MNLVGLKFGFLTIAALFVSLNWAHAQDAASKWASFSSPKGDLSLAMPANPSVQNESEIIRAFCSQGGATLDFQVRPQWNPKNMLKFAGQEFDDTGAVEVRDIKIGKVSGRTRIRTTDYYSKSIYLAGKNYYQITASAESANNPVLIEFLSSIRIDGQPLMKDPGPQIAGSVRIDSLDTSTNVREALEVSDADKISVSYDSSMKLDSHNPGGPYSQMPLILREPRPTYTEAARRANIQGEVVLFVQLKGDGSIGKVMVRKKLSNGLTENSIAAAKRIKFVPAQKNGRPIDFYVPKTYSFAIY